MKRIAIFQHYPGEGAGYFNAFAERAHLKTRLYQGYAGDALPESIADFAGMVVLGGPMSANDPLPYLAHEMRLMREAIDLQVPIIGHCLGGQLLAKVLGADVIANPGGSEIGWHPLTLLHAGDPYFADADGVNVLHWHSENFTQPDGSRLLLSSAHCPHQAFSYGIHLGMQFHLEMDADMLAHWVECEDEIAPFLGQGGVQALAALLHGSDEKLLAANRLADRVYRTWARQLKL